MGNITDPQTGHNPATSSVIPASWGDEVRNALVEVAWGDLGYAEITTNSSSFTTLADITGLEVTVTVGTDRYIEVACQGVFSAGATLGNARMHIRESSTGLAKWTETLGSGYEATMRPAVVLTPSAGEHTYKMSGEKTAGAGIIGASIEYPAWIRVTDLGSAA